ncbi:universal stress protein [Halorientalis salina]|jgi:nucleotide-binding universal stress UspA family protein|uniref:universal stress protein n=1 Tax=Halorientalis salina TaxID=2932266 RepID=UPI0010AD3074|nr:universal stress protein [Halorientalis salina]
MPAVDIDRVLVPLDGSDESLEAAEYAVAIARRYDAAVHALYVLDEAVARSLHAGEIETDTVAAETAEFMQIVEGLSADDGVPMTHSEALGFMPSQLTHHPGSVVLDTAEEIDADFLVVPREPVSGDPEDVLGKAAEYVLMYASQPVLSV